MKQFYLSLFGIIFFSNSYAQVIAIPDANFKAKLVGSSAVNQVAKDLFGNYFAIDANANGEIEIGEAQQVSYLNLEGYSIASLEGILNFSNLLELNCQNNQISVLDVSALTNLQYFNADHNLLQTMDFSGLSNLLQIWVDNNLLTSINLSGLENLYQLFCVGNQLSFIDLSPLTTVADIDISQNELTNIVATNLTNIRQFYCGDNLLTSLDLSGSGGPGLELYCFNNQLTDLDLSHTAVIDLEANNNQLHAINLKNGYSSAMRTINFNGNPNLEYICADEVEIARVQELIDIFGYTANCHVNSYCSFTPGGAFYTMQGNVHFDSNNNGCDISDAAIPNIKINITGSLAASDIVGNAWGNYLIPVQAGTYTIAPVIENPAYFNVAPASTTLAFPAQGSPFAQDFCIAPNGVHIDFETTILPVVPSRPGFDSKYLIEYKNNGTQAQSGVVSLAFDDNLLDFVSSNPVVSNQSIAVLNWNFTNLLPFETRKISVTLHANTPTQTPPVNSGTILNFTSSINGSATDETPENNIFNLHQTVVSSFDPNDKTCLEGTTISPEMVGKDVHYMIRFENTGTANAENIVVKDMIDTTKFDINSLIPLDGSHPFVTKISAGNKVEFIFENINLPFDDASNDGYVAFKIKTRPTLAVGNAFSNTASIYFDYNAPIVTNTTTTTIAALATPDFEMERYFRIYPNPANTVLNIDSKKQIEVSSISIYNTLGQLLLVVPNAQTKVDVSNLKTGNYFIKIISDKGTSNAKFIKQ